VSSKVESLFQSSGILIPLLSIFAAHCARFLTAANLSNAFGFERIYPTSANSLSWPLKWPRNCTRTGSARVADLSLSEETNSK
jgi:hypothetical protein